MDKVRIKRLFDWFVSTNKIIPRAPVSVAPNDINNIRDEITAISKDISNEQPYYSKELLVLKDCLFNGNSINFCAFGQGFEILKALTQLPDQDNQISKEDNKMIFISHRSTDKMIADALFDFFVSMGIDRSLIFCSSLPGNDPKEKISDEVKTAIKSSCLNIAILSRDYYDSAFCLNEAGIFWLQDTLVIAIVLPEIGPNEMIGFLNNDYKIRRLDNNDDIAYIYETAKEKIGGTQAPTTAFTREAQKLVSKYTDLISKREDKAKSSEINTSTVTIDFTSLTDDEYVILYYLITKKVRKIKKENIYRWLNEEEMYDVNVDNAFDLLSSSGSGSYLNDTFELNIDFSRSLTSMPTSDFSKIQSIAKSHIKLSSEKFKDLLSQKDFDEATKLFIIYIIEEKIYNLGARWMSKQQIEDIQNWEEKNSLYNTLSSNYGKCLSYFIQNDFVYESEWTDHGNPRAYTLCSSLKELLFNNSYEILPQIIDAKDNNYCELPF